MKPTKKSSTPSFLNEWNCGAFPSAVQRPGITIHDVGHLQYAGSNHPQAIIDVFNPRFGGHGRIKCDKGIVPLVLALNRFGILTIWSCQGETRESKKKDGGYIVIRIKDVIQLWDAEKIIADFWKNKYVTMMLSKENPGQIQFHAAWRKKDIQDVTYLLPTKKFVALISKRTRKYCESIHR